MTRYSSAGWLFAVFLGGMERVSPVHAAVADDTAATETTAPDGNYRCHKISPGGQLLDIGDLGIAGGRATMQGMPESSVVRSVSVIGKDDRGKPLVAVDYTSAAGWNDRLDCVRLES